MRITKRQLRKIIKEAGREERLGQARRGEIPWSDVDAEKVAQDWERQHRARAVREGQLDDAILMLDDAISELKASRHTKPAVRKTIQKVIEVLRDVADARQ